MLRQRIARGFEKCIRENLTMLSLARFPRVTYTPLMIVLLYVNTMQNAKSLVRVIEAC